ncbi:MAG: hypothetical protein ACJASQ_003051 [Crocinitomicaceae bacterium]
MVTKKAIKKHKVLENKERAITYSLLSHIRNTGTLAKGPIDIFIPLIKRALSKMNADGIYKGKSLLEIKKITDELYKIDFPVPIIKKLLIEISKEINSEATTHFTLYKDGAFSISEYSFSEFEEIIESQTTDIGDLEDLFKEFCQTSELKIVESESIFKFIEKNKFTLSKYISQNKEKNGNDYTAEAQFVNFFKKFPTIYDQIKNIYIGSIIAGYIEYQPVDSKREIELLLDTNFIVGLIDLNTPESTHTCRTLIEIAKQQKFKIQILKDTIEETTNLLEVKANNFEKSFLQKKVNPEDVYNACERRGMRRSDLERIADNLEETITSFGISLIHNTDKLKKEARFTESYKWLKDVRKTERSALHDSMAFLHVNKIRKKQFRDFDKVNAWFVNNSTSGENDSIFLRNGFQPETIKADDLLNILWLSNPQVNESIEGDDLAEIGLTSAISLTLNKNLPKSKILRELDDNINKYAKEEVSDTDIIRVATRITNKQLKNIDELNLLAENDKAAFVKRLEEEAAKQKQIDESRISKLEEIFDKISIKTIELDEARVKFNTKSEGIDSLIQENESKENQLKSKLLNVQNVNRELFRDAWVSKKISRWRRRTWIELCIILFLFVILSIILVSQYNWDIPRLFEKIKKGEISFVWSFMISSLFFIFNAITIKTLLGKYRNHSNIQNYVKALKIPEEMRELKEPI